MEYDFICQDNCHERLAKAIKAQDHMEIWQIQKWAQQMLSPAEFVELFTDSVDKMSEEDSMWFKLNFGTYRLTTGDEFIAPSIQQCYVGGQYE
jgi:hypothetical protein